MDGRVKHLSAEPEFAMATLTIHVEVSADIDDGHDSERGKDVKMSEGMPNTYVDFTCLKVL